MAVGFVIGQAEVAGALHWTVAVELGGLFQCSSAILHLLVQLATSHVALRIDWWG